LRSSRADIKIYISGSEYPIDVIHLPTRFSTNDLNEPDFVWLNFCLDGAKVNLKPSIINKFWTQNDINPTKYQRGPNNKAVSPDSSVICGTAKPSATKKAGAA